MKQKGNRAIKSLSLILSLTMAVTAVSGSVSAAFQKDLDMTSGKTDGFIAKMTEMYAEPEIEYWPQVRWWMPQGHHTDETLIEEAELIKDSGFGAIEVLAMSENAVTPASRYSWGSPEWNNDTQLLLREATKHGLGMSLTSGTNWGNANLPNTFEFEGKPFDADNPAAMQVLSYGQQNIGPGESIDGALPAAGVEPAATVDVQARKKYFVGAVAARLVSDSSTPTLSATDIIDLTDQVQGTDENRTLRWTNNSNDTYVLLTFWQHGSGLTANPSYATNYTINYVDKLGAEAVKQYWDENIFTPEMQEVIDENGKVEFYMDSLEIGQGNCNGGTLWGFDFADTFEQNRGYSVIKYLPFLIYRKHNSYSSAKTDRFQVDPKDADLIAKVQNDMYQTKTEMYQENILGPLRDWLHTHNMTLRAEISYGQLFEVSTPGKYVDHIETETLEFNSSIDSYRNLSGTSHLYDKVLSCETGANSGGALYRNTQDFYNHNIFEGFVAGVSRTVLHTYSSVWAPSEATAEWPGYTPNASWSDRFGSRQPYFHLEKDWTTMISRYQKALRQGKAKVDLGILRTDYDMNGRIGEEGYTANSTLPTIRHNEGLYWRDFALQEAGYTYDYFSPLNLEEEEVYYDKDTGVVIPDGPAYQALLIYQDTMPLSSAKILLEWAKQGLPIIIANDTEELTPNTNMNLTENSFNLKYDKAAVKTPFYDGKDEELAEVMAEMKALPNVTELNPDQPGLKLGDGSSQSKAPRALKDLGVHPRAEYGTSNNKFITNMRETENELYTYVYNYAYDAKKHLSHLWGTTRPMPDTESYTTEISIDALGKPYFFDAYSGEFKEASTYRYENGRTIVDVTLEPGEATMVVLNKNDTQEKLHAVSTAADDVVYIDGKTYIAASESGCYETVLSNGTTVTTEVAAPSNIELSRWNLELESWEAGELLTRTETRDENFAGEEYTTTEYTTEKVKRPIHVGETDLVPWRSLNIENADKITGVGYYTTNVTLPENWSSENGAYLQIGSINQGSAAVYVNGEKVPGGVDVCNPRKDISNWLKPGENTIRVEVTASSLCNSVQTGKYAPSAAIKNIGADVQDYGMTGETKLVTYTKSLVTPNEANKKILNQVIAYAELQKEDSSFENVIDIVKASFTDALDRAKDVSSDISADQDTVDNAWQALMKEIHKLGFIRGDKTTLGLIIQVADGYNAKIDLYTPATAAEFVSVLEAAKAVYNDGNTMQDEVKQTEEELLNAMQQLRYKADKSVLESVLADTSQIDATQYTEVSVAFFNEAKETATNVYNNPEATQDEVNEAADNLKAAIDGLQVVQSTDDTPVTTIGGDSAATTESGNAKTGETAPISIVFTMLSLAGTGIILRRKKK